MKSEKAMEYVGRHNWPDEDTNIRAIYCYHVQDAIELAEQEAEERMRKKAIEAFKALAAMNDENDLEQWFVVEHTGSADELVLADSEDALAYIQSGDGWRKASVEEIIEHFKK